MNILFHENQLCLRGTSVALYDYARYNEEILGNNSYITFDINSSWNDKLAIEKFIKRFPDKIIPYASFSHVNQICDNLNIDAFYIIKSGEYDGKLSNRKNCVHAVFQAYQPHGDVYAYVSEWLSKKMTNGISPYVPHIVSLPDPNKNVRNDLGLPMDAFVFGRYGGYDQFDIDFAKEAIFEFLDKQKNCYFVFYNTKPFGNHERIKYFDSIVDLQDKSNFIDSCNAMLHARSMGESFGLAMCEFLHGNKPVLSWSGGHDRHHADILPKDLLYTDKADLIYKMSKLYESKSENNYKELVQKFSPYAVINKFKQVFLD